MIGRLPSARRVSRLTRGTLALVLAGGRGTRLEMLTEWRAKPAVHFGGKFRIVDFALSNCINSSIRRICLLTQYKAHSLIRHSLRAWTNLRGELGEFLELVPAQQWIDEDLWYTGTADAVYQSLDIVASHQPDYLLILAGDHVYKMDYGEMLAAHVAAEADLTVACHRVPLADARQMGVMKVATDNRIEEFTEKPEEPEPLPDRPDRALASMGIYVFSVDYLIRELQRDAADAASSHDFGNDLIPHAVQGGHAVYAYAPGDPDDPVEPYWRDVGTIDAYYRANLELLDPHPALDLYDPAWRIWTYQGQLPPGKLIVDDDGRPGVAENAMVSGGCVVAGGRVRRSILFSNVHVGGHCKLDESLVLPDCRLGRDVRLKRVIVDRACRIPDGTVIGKDPEHDAERFHLTPEGIVVVTRDMLGQRGPHPAYGASRRVPAR